MNITFPQAFIVVFSSDRRWSFSHWALGIILSSLWWQQLILKMLIQHALSSNARFAWNLWWHFHVTPTDQWCLTELQDWSLPRCSLINVYFPNAFDNYQSQQRFLLQQEPRQCWSIMKNCFNFVWFIMKLIPMNWSEHYYFTIGEQPWVYINSR